MVSTPNVTDFCRNRCCCCCCSAVATDLIYSTPNVFEFCSRCLCLCLCLGDDVDDVDDEEDIVMFMFVASTPVVCLLGRGGLPLQLLLLLLLLRVGAAGERSSMVERFSTSPSPPRMKRG